MVAEFDAGTEIAGYRIESVIGRGGMAVVYRAEDSRLGRKVALKLLTPSLAENEQFQQRFIRESRLAASLDHPNIVPIYEAGEADGHLFIAMRYVPGSDLKQLLSQQGPLPPARILRLFVQIGDALDAAHLLGLVHRDVKPGNILITSVAEHSGHAHPDHVYLTDFGLTKRTSSLSGSLTGTGHFLGTVDYVSPEQIQGAPVGPSTDIYALGCVLYECLTGRLPFNRDDDAAVLWAHLVELPPPVSALRPELPAAVDDVVFRAMAKAPEDRYDSCRDLVRDLEYALNASIDLPATSHAGSRQEGRHGRSAYPVEDVPPTSELPRSPQGVLPAAPPDDDAPRAPDTSVAGGGWVSHPSLPPGAMEPPSWDPNTALGDERPGDERLEAERLEAERLDGGREPSPTTGGEGDDADAAGDYDPFDDLEADERQEVYGIPGGDEPEEGEPEEGEEPWVAQGTAPAQPPAPRARRRAAVIAAIAVVTVIGVVAAVWFLQVNKQEVLKPFTSQDTLVPYSLKHPESWTARTGAASDVVLSPRPDDMGDAFLTDATDRWGGTRQLLASSSQDATGVYVYTQASGSDTSVEGLRRTITDLLGRQSATVDLGTSHRQQRVGGAPGHEFEGYLSDPQAPGTRLYCMFDLVLPQAGGLALFTFFSAPDDFEGNRELFTRVRDSITFPGG